MTGVVHSWKYMITYCILTYEIPILHTMDSTYIRCCILAIMDTVAVLLDEPSGMMG